jgi:uncharacterized integral membrane protein
MKTLKKIILFVLIVIFLIFSFQNRQDIPLTFFNWSTQIPTSLVIVATYVLGMFSGGLVWMLLKTLVTNPQKQEKIKEITPEIDGDLKI